MPKRSLASRLATLYTVLLGVTVLLVVIASSIALIYELAGFSNDIIIAKHEEARFLAARFQNEGQTLAQAAPRIARDLSGIGLRVAVYDTGGKFLGGDRSVHPDVLDRVVRGRTRLAPPPSSAGEPIENPPGTHGRGGSLLTSPRHDWWAIIAVEGGYVTFEASGWIIFANLIPYWWIIFGIAVVALGVSWFVGRIVARQALAPMNEVTGSLRALADGDYTQRQFVTAGGDEVSTLTEAYNDAAASVAAAMDERRATEARMRQFVADAGHELRTPLTVIAGYIDVLRRGAIEEPKVAKQILSTMSLEKEHMRGLVDRLMRLARMEGENAPEPVEIDVPQLLRDQCEAARRMDEERPIDYSVDGVKAVYADRGEIGEALWNVVENALKYAPGAPIHLRAFREDGSTVLSVADEGPGMSESERLHAFERFYRGDARGEIPGTGLGLAIAKRAVDRAGGSISIQSAPGRGTIVSIKL
ncbi:MAG TPA: HAMP domain-containing sensor histidine kinase [Candidatus Baltobacteraceae bacterium]